MNVAWSDEQLRACLAEAATVSKEHPVVISDFIEGAVEIEMDGVCKDGEIIGAAIHEHIENVLDKHYYDIRNSDNDSDYDEYLRNTFYVCPDKDKEASKLNSLILPQVLMIL